MELPPRADPEMYSLKGAIGTTLVAGLPDELLVYCHENFPEIPNISFKEAILIFPLAIYLVVLLVG